MYRQAGLSGIGRSGSGRLGHAANDDSNGDWQYRRGLRIVICGAGIATGTASGATTTSRGHAIAPARRLAGQCWGGNIGCHPRWWNRRYGYGARNDTTRLQLHDP